MIEHVPAITPPSSETRLDVTKRKFREAKRRMLSLRKSAAGLDYQIAEIMHLRRVFREYSIDFVFDVGANAGQYALMLRRDVGYTGRIASFEPLPALGDHLDRLTRSDPKWEVHKLALSRTTGEADFHVMHSDQFSSLSMPSSDFSKDYDDVNFVHKTVKVKTESLETVFLQNFEKYGFKNPYLKMDTQGHDLAVFMSGEAIIEKFVAVQSEIAFKPLYQDAAIYADSLKIYQDKGFDLSALVPNNRLQFPWLIEMDAILLNRAFVS